jgi:tRNA (mo5U34)-methyltransferase
MPLQARSRMLDEGWPKMSFIEHALAGDATNWWAASPGCVEAMLRSSGLAVRARPGHEIWVCEPAPSRGGEHAEMVRAELLAATGRAGEA